MTDKKLLASLMSGSAIPVKRHGVSGVVSSAGGGFLPTDISGLILWLDASEGITKSSDLVSQWDDQSGNSNDVAESTNKPTWTDSELNGLPAVVFGSDTSLAKATWSGGAVSQPYYVFAVMKFGQNTSSQYQWDGGGSSNRFYWYTNVDKRVASSGTELDMSVNPANNYYYITFFVNGATSNQRRDGVSQITGNLGGGSFNGITLASRYSEEAYNNPKICEFLVYDNDIGDTDRDKVEEYLKDKYDL